MRKLLVLASLILTACQTTGTNTGYNPNATGCGPNNCAGCCSGGVCVAGNEAFACGLGGGMCDSCDSGDVCNAYGTCVLDPASKWTVWPVKASIESSNNGTSWDGDGSAPDVIVSTSCPGGSVGVSEKVESYYPTFSYGGCVATAGDLLAKGITFSLKDSDLTVDDSITGNVAMAISSADLATGSRTGTPTSGGCKSIQFQFTRK
ncbi:MAG: hypothetical protein HY902_15100 [Deltaproteobacteria bacterium]|nr:hypothetical protein [Deltaproteobacteria bacterium]